MSAPLLVEFFNALPEDALRGGLDWPTSQSIADRTDPHAASKTAGCKSRRRPAVHVFCKQVQERYFEGTLLRLLDMEDSQARRAAVFALGLLGSPSVNEVLATRLHDEEE